MNKTKSAITRAEFRESAQPIKVEINGNQLMAPVKEFATGSLGWYLAGKTMVDIGGKLVNVQIGLNLTIIGSKGLPDEPTEAFESGKKQELRVPLPAKENEQ